MVLLHVGHRRVGGEPPGLRSDRPDLEAGQRVPVDLGDGAAVGFHASVRSRPTGPGTSTRTTTATRAPTPATSAATCRAPHGSFVEREALDAARPAPASAGRRRPPAPTVQLRTYRLALLSDPSYATYFGTDERHRREGHADEPRQPDLRGRPRDPDGAGRRQRQAQLRHRGGGDRAERAVRHGSLLSPPAAARVLLRRTLIRNQIVLGQLIGARNYDIGHIALGVNGGGVAGLGVVGSSDKARGCTGLPTPGGRLLRDRLRRPRDGPPVRRQPHLQRHPVRTARAATATPATSVEPGCGSSIMAYAGHLPAGRPAAAQRPVLLAAQHQRDHATYLRRAPPINEVQTVSLRNFDTDGDSFTLTFNGATTRRRSCAGRTTRRPGSRRRSSRITGWPAERDGRPSPASAAPRQARRRRLPGHVRRHARRHRRQRRAACALDRRRRRDRLRRRDRQGRPGRQRRLDGHATGNHAPVVTAPDAVHDPGPHAVHPDRQRDRRRRRHAHLHVGAERRGGGGRHRADQQHQDERPAVPAVRHAAPTSPDEHADYAVARRERRRRPTRRGSSRTWRRSSPDNTNAETGTCPPPPPTPGQHAVSRCRRRRLLLGVPADRRLGRHRPATGRHCTSGSRRATEPGRRRRRPRRHALTLAPTAGPFLVTSQAAGTRSRRSRSR